jgi:hypothetical protein
MINDFKAKGQDAASEAPLERKYSRCVPGGTQLRNTKILCFERTEQHAQLPASLRDALRF